MTRKTVKLDPVKLLGFRLEQRPGAKCGNKPSGVKAGTKPRDFINARAMLGGKPRIA